MRVFHRLGANHHVGPLAVWRTAPASKAEGDARAHLDRGNGSNIATRLVVQGHVRMLALLCGVVGCVCGAEVVAGLLSWS